MTIDEYAEKCGVHPNTVRMWVLRGLLDVSIEVRGKGQYKYQIGEKTPPPKLRPGPKPFEMVWQEMEERKAALLVDKSEQEPPWDQLRTDD